MAAENDDRSCILDVWGNNLTKDFLYCLTQHPSLKVVLVPNSIDLDDEGVQKMIKSELPNVRIAHHQWQIDMADGLEAESPAD